MTGIGLHRTGGPVGATVRQLAAKQLRSDFMRESMITLADRRELSIADYGVEDGPAVLYFHGAPSSRLDALMYEDEIDASGIRVIAIDRPGFGRSSPQPGRVLADWPNNVAQVADQLGLESFAVVGASAGGVHAIA